MKIKDGFILRDVGGKTFVVAVGKLSKKFHGMIVLNETAKAIWNCFKSDATREDAISVLAKEYDAPIEIIEKDVDDFISKLKEENILE